jgi:hypothetical protein
MKASPAMALCQHKAGLISLAMPGAGPQQQAAGAEFGHWSAVRKKHIVHALLLS